MSRHLDLMRSVNANAAGVTDIDGRSTPADPRSVKVTQRIREEAIRICAVAASAPFVSHSCDWIVLALDVTHEAGELADEAWSCARPILDDVPLEGESVSRKVRRLDHNRRAI